MKDLMNFDMPINRSSIIKVFGIGGGGSNAVNHMFEKGIKDVDFVICNTDAQALINSPVPIKIQLGASLTEGRGAGNKPAIGREAAIENIDDVIEILANNTKMVFITAGMGGGTGTGAAPVIAKAAKELGILTVAIVTIPFRNEGQRRISQAMDGISEIEKYVDSLLIINNEKIREMYGNLRVSEAFSYADDVLSVAAKGIAEIITVHGYINVDFADVETVMANSGVSIMGSAVASGTDRAVEAIEKALNSPLLNDNNIEGARNLLINITSGTEEATMDEIGQITDYIQASAGDDADMIWGNGVDENLGDALCVTIIATGFETSSIPELYVRKKQLDKIPLDKQFTIEEQTKAEEQTGFEVKEKKIPSKKESNVISQRTIEFEVASTSTPQNPPANEIDQSVEVRRAADRIKNINRNYEQMRELNLSHRERQINIDDLESQPAYMRKNIQLDNSKPSTENKISKFSLDDDEDGGVKLSSNNKYLHDTVD